MAETSKTGRWKGQSNILGSIITCVVRDSCPDCGFVQSLLPHLAEEDLTDDGEGIVIIRTHVNGQTCVEQVWVIGILTNGQRLGPGESHVVPTHAGVSAEWKHMSTYHVSMWTYLMPQMMDMVGSGATPVTAQVKLQPSTSRSMWSGVAEKKRKKFIFFLRTDVFFRFEHRQSETRIQNGIDIDNRSAGDGIQCINDDWLTQNGHVLLLKVLVQEGGHLAGVETHQGRCGVDEPEGIVHLGLIGLVGIGVLQVDVTLKSISVN